MKRIVVTGAAGFVGRHLCLSILSNTDWEIVCVDVAPITFLNNSDRIEVIHGDVGNERVLAQVLSKKVDGVVHLAALPGGSAEADPLLSKKVNVDSPIRFFDKLSLDNPYVRIVYASTIAVLGADFDSSSEGVNDNTSPNPAITYGFHKAIVELELSEMSRRGKVDAISLRLPGIVARPANNSGLKSAFMSDIFHALKSKERYTVPVPETGTVWIMSVQQCVSNLIFALTSSTALLGVNRAVNLPCTWVSLCALAQEICHQTGASSQLVSWSHDEVLARTFANYPALTTVKADKLGFCSDDSLSSLVSRALSLI